MLWGGALLPYVLYMLQIHMWYNRIIVWLANSMINSPKRNIRGLHTWWFDCTTTCVFATWAITTIKKFMIRLHRVLPYNTSLSIHFWKVLETKCQRNEFLNRGSKRTVHGQFGQSQFGQLRLQKVNKNEDVWKNVCCCFFSLLFSLLELGML